MKWKNSLIPEIKKKKIIKLFSVYDEFESLILEMDNNIQYEPIRLKLEQLDSNQFDIFA
jgi:hypothetical protein